MTRAPRRTKSAVTIRTVAERAGVSAMTVSNVLRGRQVAPQTREAVLLAAKELNFKPNAAAQQLASASSVSIGVLQGDIEHSFFSELLVAALNAAAERDAQILLQHVEFNRREGAWQAVETLRERGAQAVLLPGVIAEAMARTGERISLPAVAVGPGEELPGIPSLRIDEVAAARELTRHLIAKGHRRIGYLGPPDGYHLAHARERGFRQALADAGIAPSSELMTSAHFDLKANIALADSLLELANRPTAIVAWNDDFAACALIAGHRHGLRIPEDIAVTGFDDGALAMKVWPALTTVRQPVTEMATAAIEGLVQHVRSGGALPVTDRLLPHRIMLRASTGD